MRIGIPPTRSLCEAAWKSPKQASSSAPTTTRRSVANFYSAAGRIWRYELEPTEDGTRVRESWDVSQDHQKRMLKLGGMPQKTEANMAKTLDRIAELTETPA